MSRAELARRKNRSKACITKWVKLGKISPAALLDDGTIWLERAEADLAASLDPSQQLAQNSPASERAAQRSPGLATATIGIGAPPPPPVMPPQLTERQADMARRTKADADRAELELEGARRRMAVEQGRWVVAEDAARAWTREVSRFISDTETFHSTTLARDIAAAHGLDWKALSVEIREKFRAFRAEASGGARGRREAIESDEAARRGPTNACSPEEVGSDD